MTMVRMCQFHCNCTYAKSYLGDAKSSQYPNGWRNKDNENGNIFKKSESYLEDIKKENDSF